MPVLGSFLQGNSGGYLWLNFIVNHTPLALETLFHLNITQFLGTVPSDSDSDIPHVSCKIELIYSNTHRNCLFFYPSDGKYLRIEDSHVHSLIPPLVLSRGQ